MIADLVSSLTMSWLNHVYNEKQLKPPDHVVLTKPLGQLGQLHNRIKKKKSENS